MSCWWKALQNLIHYSWIFNVQLYVHLKKWTLKFKLLYLLNHIHVSYFNKICRMCYLNTHVQSLTVWLKSVLPWLKYRIFLGDCFLLADPVHHQAIRPAPGSQSLDSETSTQRAATPVIMATYCHHGNTSQWGLLVKTAGRQAGRVGAVLS